MPGLSTLTRYDRIVMLEAGRVVEDGGLQELLHAGGAFRRLWELQSGETCEQAATVGPNAV